MNIFVCLCIFYYFVGYISGGKNEMKQPELVDVVMHCSI